MFLFLFVSSALALQARSHITFFAPVASVEGASKLALAWALMRTQYPRAELLVFVNGPDTETARESERLCAMLRHCRWFYFTQRDIFAKQPGDIYIHVNGDQGMLELFGMYRTASAMSQTELLVLLQPDCLVRGRIAQATLDRCVASGAGVCSHHQPHNVMEPHLLRAIKTAGSEDTPSHYSFTCGSLWRRSKAPLLFAESVARSLFDSGCNYDDACIGCAIYIAGVGRIVSSHIQDWKFGDYDNMSPILHADKRHYKKGWHEIPPGLCPFYEELKRQWGADEDWK